jgi:hypothetical protein
MFSARFSEAAQEMLRWRSLKLGDSKELQKLWAGYGYICAITATPDGQNDEKIGLVEELYGSLKGSGESYPFVMKFISPPDAEAAGESESYHRKMLSYEVEQYFYTQIAPRLPEDVAVADCIASTYSLDHTLPGAKKLKGVTATIMADLRPLFPVAGEKRAHLTSRQVLASLDWLAKFHGSSWAWLPEPLDDYVLPPLEERKRRQSSQPVTKVWLNGGYTYLATRRSEYNSLDQDQGSEWCAAFCEPFSTDSTLSVAEAVANFLVPRGRAFETYIHGDVKSENLFSTEDGSRVAFFDFQYVGLGLGACDLAKLFTCSVPLGMLTDRGRDIPDKLGMASGEKQLLQTYFKTLTSVKDAKPYEWNDFLRHWETALVDWCRFQASWGFWGNTEWLEARVRFILADKGWREWLQHEMSQI